MIPLRDSIKSSMYPYVTVSIVVINTVVFVLQNFLSIRELNIFFQVFGVIPAYFTQLTLFQLLGAGLFPMFSLITAIFIHGSWLHLISNMIYLWVFGDNVEDKLGHLGFLVFYLVVGMVGSFAHILANPDSTIPTIGASGSIAGVLGAYLIFYPKAKVQAIIPLLIIYTITRIRAVYFLILWFALQLLNGVTLMAAGTAVAWWAHIGGFLGGAAIALFFSYQLYQERI